MDQHNALTVSQATQQRRRSRRICAWLVFIVFAILSIFNFCNRVNNFPTLAMFFAFMAGDAYIDYTEDKKNGLASVILESLAALCCLICHLSCILG